MPARGPALSRRRDLARVHALARDARSRPSGSRALGDAHGGEHARRHLLGARTHARDELLAIFRAEDHSDAVLAAARGLRAFTGVDMTPPPRPAAPPGAARSVTPIPSFEAPPSLDEEDSELLPAARGEPLALALAARDLRGRRARNLRGVALPAPRSRTTSSGCGASWPRSLRRALQRRWPLPSPQVQPSPPFLRERARPARVMEPTVAATDPRSRLTLAAPTAISQVMHAQNMAIVKSLVSVAWADGTFADAEREMVEALISAFEATEDQAKEIRTYAETRKTIDDIPVEELSDDDCRILLQHAVLLSYVDGAQHAEEKALIEAMAKKPRHPRPRVGGAHRSRRAARKAVPEAAPQLARWQRRCRRRSPRTGCGS